MSEAQDKGTEMISRAYTPEEVRKQFLDAVRGYVSYWDKLEGEHSVTDRLNGLAFSILNIIDGTSMSLPAFDLIPHPHEDDKEYHISQGENYYEPVVINDGDYLHDQYYQVKENDHG